KNYKVNEIAKNLLKVDQDYNTANEYFDEVDKFEDNKNYEVIAVNSDENSDNCFHKVVDNQNHG
ncbi:3963_t:CDS:1, partial [Racocetra fulgida]